MLKIIPYDRFAGVSYAHRWAYERNPKYMNFDELGGDCTNFASQCLYAGAGVMNFTPTIAGKTGLRRGQGYLIFLTF